MSRRKKRAPIPVEDISPDPQADEFEELESLGRRIRVYNRQAFDKVLALSRAYVAAYERPNESAEAFAARMRQVEPKKPVWN